MHRSAMSIAIARRRSVSCCIARVHRIQSSPRYFRSLFVCVRPTNSPGSVGWITWTHKASRLFWSERVVARKNDFGQIGSLSISLRRSFPATFAAGALGRPLRRA